jgi:tetratricopeptide (TPR) repeat protein
MDIKGLPEIGSESTPQDPVNGQVKKHKPGKYISEVYGHLVEENYESAYATIQKGFVEYPDDPYVLSFYGFLLAIVEKKHRIGVDMCKKAISTFEKSAGTAQRMVLFPILYMNLGRAYAAAGRRTDAIIAFSQGLHYDHEHAGIMQEMKRLGMRKPPPIPFLDRSNPLNVYLGKAMSKKKKKA